jgi:hypothetical protein
MDCQAAQFGTVRAATAGVVAWVLREALVGPPHHGSALDPTICPVVSEHRSAENRETSDLLSGSRGQEATQRLLVEEFK